MFFELLTLCRFSLPFGKYFTKKSQSCSYRYEKTQQLYIRNLNSQLRMGLNRSFSRFALVDRPTLIELRSFSTNAKF